MTTSKHRFFTIIFLPAIFLLLFTPALAEVTYVEDFSDPLSGWTTRWFYQNTNAENYYVAWGGVYTCDPDNRGNEPNGIWIARDRGCGNYLNQVPLKIDFLNNFGDDAISFSIAVGNCLSDTLNIYDKDGVLVASDAIPANCQNFSNVYNYSLSNGISAFEFAQQMTTPVDNIILTKPDNIIILPKSSPQAVPTLTEWGLIVCCILLAGSAIWFIRRRKQIS